MEFAKGLLMKYGWTEGKGLGASESGMINPIKLSFRSNLQGLGHDVGKDFKFHWWDHVYNKAVKNISVNELEGGGVKLSHEKNINISTKIPSRASRKKAVHENFVAGGLLTGSTEVNRTTESNSSDSEDEVRHDSITNLSNDQLFNICGGLTAHKGARHGINMTAKLARIESADALLEVANTKPDAEIEFNSKENQKKKKKKKARDKKKEEEKFDDFLNEFTNHGIDVKKRKSVTFAECMEDVQEFFSHRRIISKGRKHPIKNEDVDDEIDVGMDVEVDDIVCEEVKKFDCKKRKRKSCELDDTSDNFGECLFLDANDSLIVNKFSKIKKNKHRLRDEVIENNVTTAILDDLDRNDFDDAVENENEIEISKKIKKNKHKLRDTFIENNISTPIIKDSGRNDFIEADVEQNDINISKKIKKNKHKLENDISTPILDDSDKNEFVENSNEIEISKKLKKNKHKLEKTFIENDISTPILDELPLQKLKKKKSKRDMMDESIYEGKDSFEDTPKSKKKNINI